MDCTQARQLFDAYLDGELTGSLKTELGAHRLRCADCRRELALLEVSGHIITSDRASESLSDGFTDRLLACMPQRRTNWYVRYRRALYVATPLAAAALIAIAFSGTWWNPANENHVAGQIVEANQDLLDKWADEDAGAVTGANNVSPADARAAELDKLFGQMKENIEIKKEAGESVQRFFNLSVIQLLDIVNQPQPAEIPAVTPLSDDPDSADEQDDESTDGDDAVEDL